MLVVAFLSDNSCMGDSIGSGQVGQGEAGRLSGPGGGGIRSDKELVWAKCRLSVLS